jgi:hypothetical protein
LLKPPIPVRVVSIWMLASVEGSNTKLPFGLAGPIAEMHATGADVADVGAGLTRLTPEQAKAYPRRPVDR